MKESKSLEFKQTMTNTFLKTVSAFANYDGGTIIFGIADDGSVSGISDPDGFALSIENKVNDGITPHPDYTISINRTDKTVSLEVRRGASKPYLYKAKAYKRNDTATIEVDNNEFTRMVLEGKNINFEELPSGKEHLRFNTLEQRLREHTGIEKFALDVLRTLNLYSNDSGYNNAAAILADVNDFPVIDVAKFGENISIINKRKTFGNMSIITAYDSAVELFRDYYQYEEISGMTRNKVELIPEESFREAIANALIHRTWDMKTYIRVSMFDDRIEIVSPGGLPYGITNDEYLSGRISLLRNPVIGNVFFRLGLVELFGTGVFRIMQAYENSMRKPVFETSDNVIKVTLPVIGPKANLTKDEAAVYSALSKVRSKSISEITDSVEFGKSKTTELLKALSEEGIVSIVGNGRGTKYHA